MEHPPAFVKPALPHPSKPFLALGLWARLGLAGMAALGLCQCKSMSAGKTATVATNVVVSVKDQKLAFYSKGGTVARAYPVSTSKFGLSDKPGKYGTPLGLHEVVAKIGHGARPGTVFKSRQATGEVIKPDAPGRDPIVSRIMWLRGLEKQNQNAYGRCIYIHGTAAEKDIGRPASYGCIRMKSKDVIDLFQNLEIGSRVLIVEGKLPSRVPVAPPIEVKPVPADAPPIFLNPQQSAPVPVPPTPGTPHPQRREPGQPLQPVILAQNNAIPSEGAPPPQAASGLSPYRSTQTASGSTVIYSAPGSTSSSSITLKSRRAAVEGKMR